MFKYLKIQRLSFLKMQGKNPSKIASLLQKGILAKEKFNLDRKLGKTFDNMTNYFATSYYYLKKN